MPYLRCICTPLRKRLRWFPSWFETSRLATNGAPSFGRGPPLAFVIPGLARREPGTTGPVYSLLTLRAPERRAAVLGKAPNDAATPRGLAFLAFAVINLERVLEITEFAGGLAMVAQRRAAGLDRLIQHRVNGIDQAFGVIGRLSFFCRQGRGQSSRRQMRTKQRLTDIDVAEARDHALIEQRRLQAGLLAGTGARQHGGVEFIAERFGA